MDSQPFSKGLEALKGLCPGTVIYHHPLSHYIYKHKETRKYTSHYACINKDCSGKISLTEDSFILSTKHNHEGSISKYNEIKFITTCKERANREKLSLIQIYDEEIVRFTSHRPNISYNEMELALADARRKYELETPLHVEQLSLALVTARYGKTVDGLLFYRTLLQLPDQSESLVFASKSQISLLEQSTELHVDRTFSYVPHKPKFVELLTIHASVWDCSFPVVYVLLTKRSKEAYTQIFDYVLSLTSKCIPSVIFTDYEPDIQGALLGTFGKLNCQIEGCFSQYIQALNIQLSDPMCDLQRTFANGSEEERHLLRQTFVLPLLPPQSADEGLEVLKELCNSLKKPEIRLKVEKFLQYIDDYWFTEIGADVFSVHGCVRRTSRAVPRFHIKLWQDVCNRYTNIWYFIDKLAKCENIGHLESVKVLSGDKIAKLKEMYIGNEKLIKRYTNFLEENRITVKEFLSCCFTKVFSGLSAMFTSEVLSPAIAASTSSSYVNNLPKCHQTLIPNQPINQNAPLNQILLNVTLPNNSSFSVPLTPQSALQMIQNAYPES